MSEESVSKPSTLEGDIKELKNILGRKLAPLFVPIEGRPELRAGGHIGSANVKVSIEKNRDGKAMIMLQIAGEAPFDNQFTVYDAQTHAMDKKGAKRIKEFLEMHRIDLASMRLPKGWG